ncbi:hypothetical protein QL285_052061 [Trifolium repens]|nr:hypothetical protein QL285_052061 [Trifolium repens]
MTKTDPNTKKNLQNPRKASRRSQECKKTRKSKKCEDLCCSSCHDGFHRVTMASIVPRWKLLVSQEINRENLKKICSSCYDAPHRGTTTLFGDQADETHRISYNSELNLPIVLRWTYRSTMAC